MSSLILNDESKSLSRIYNNKSRIDILFPVVVNPLSRNYIVHARWLKIVIYKFKQRADNLPTGQGIGKFSLPFINNDAGVYAVLYSVVDSWITIDYLVLLLTQRSMSPIRGTFAINSSGVAEELTESEREQGEGVENERGWRNREGWRCSGSRHGVLGKIVELTFVE